MGKQHEHYCQRAQDAESAYRNLLLFGLLSGPRNNTPFPQLRRHHLLRLQELHEHARRRGLLPWQTPVVTQVVMPMQRTRASVELEQKVFAPAPKKVHPRVLELTEQALRQNNRGGRA